jgi:hypothetical protein
MGQSIRRKRLASQGRVLVAVRVISGDIAGGTKKWRIGTAEVRPGELVFTSTVGGILFLKRSPVTLPVTAVEAAKVRPPSLGEAVRLNEMKTIVPATFPGGELELALEPQTAQWVISTLLPASEAGAGGQRPSV